jgi:hypothetical protein
VVPPFFVTASQQPTSPGMNLPCPVTGAPGRAWPLLLQQQASTIDSGVDFDRLSPSPSTSGDSLVTTPRPTSLHHRLSHDLSNSTMTGSCAST